MYRHHCHNVSNLSHRQQRVMLNSIYSLVFSILLGEEDCGAVSRALPSFGKKSKKSTVMSM